MDRLDLAHQVFRHGGPLRLVFGVERIAKGLALGIEHAGNISRVIVRAQTTQHIDDAVHGARRGTFGVTQVGHGVEGAVEITRTIDQQQGVVHNVLSAGEECQKRPFGRNPTIIAEFAPRSHGLPPHPAPDRFVTFHHEGGGAVCYNDD